jgi:hypothetical protein
MPACGERACALELAGTAATEPAELDEPVPAGSLGQELAPFLPGMHRRRIASFVRERAPGAAADLAQRPVQRADDVGEPAREALRRSRCIQHRLVEGSDVDAQRPPPLPDRGAGLRPRPAAMACEHVQALRSDTGLGKPLGDGGD